MFALTYFHLKFHGFSSDPRRLFRRCWAYKQLLHTSRCALLSARRDQLAVHFLAFSTANQSMGCLYSAISLLTWWPKHLVEACTHRWHTCEGLLEVSDAKRVQPSLFAYPQLLSLHPMSNGMLLSESLYCAPFRPEGRVTLLLPLSSADANIRDAVTDRRPQADPKIGTEQPSGKLPLSVLPIMDASWLRPSMEHAFPQKPHLQCRNNGWLG